MRLFLKAFRRALLPVRWSRGKAPKPRISIPYPLPVGVESFHDVLDVETEFLIHPEDVKDRLNRNLPEGVDVLSARRVPAGERRTLSGLEYTVQGRGLPEPRRLAEFVKTSTWTVERLKKDRMLSVDIRPYVEVMSLTHEDRMLLVLKVDQGRSTRPDEVLRALGLDAATVAGLNIVRTGVREAVV
jgi:radical SAM-linked protein